LAYPTRYGNRRKGLPVVKNISMTRAGGILINASKGGGKSKCMHYSAKIIVGHPIVGLFLV
jgi:hypothetical protein